MRHGHIRALLSTLIIVLIALLVKGALLVQKYSLQWRIIEHTSIRYELLILNGSCS
jgi:hypothetical protein